MTVQWVDRSPQSLQPCSPSPAGSTPCGLPRALAPRNPRRFPETSKSKGKCVNLPPQILPCRIHISVAAIPPSLIHFPHCHDHDLPSHCPPRSPPSPLRWWEVRRISPNCAHHKVRIIPLLSMLGIMMVVHATHRVAATGPASVHSSITGSCSFHSVCAGFLPDSGGCFTSSTPTSRVQDGTSWPQCVTSTATQRRPCSSCWSTLATCL